MPIATAVAVTAMHSKAAASKEASALTLPSISPAFLVEFSIALMRDDCSEQLFSSMQLYSVCAGEEGV